MKKKIYWLIPLFFIIDLISKQVVIHLIDLHKSIKVIPNFFYITYVRNTGAAFSVFQNKRILILLITVIALFYIYKCLIKENLNKWEEFSYSMITGGILGNLFDRVIYGYVIDYYDFRLFGYNYPIFNMADVFIVVGVIILLIYTTIIERKKHGSISRKG